ncbi:MAG: energy-coupling factor transporter ATPase [Clostridia bacterium]|nr:energy-coupling factor transporter ATPase [Clostridia bacterium]
MFTLNHVSYSYKADSPVRAQALSDISLSIKKGECVGLIGHTGSGKSTLAQILSGLLTPTSGTVSFEDTPLFIKNKFNRALRGQIGLVFQYPEYQLFEETVLKDIAYGPMNLGATQSEAFHKARTAAQLLGLSEEVFDKSPLQLSGGQKRRVAIAGILAMEPQVLILDEPTAGLDPEGREELLKILKNLHKSTGNTTILISHSMDFVAGFTERIIVLNRGSLWMDGTPQEIFSDPEKLKVAGLAPPPVSELFSLFGFPVPPVFTAEEAVSALLPYMHQGGGSVCK